MWQTEPKEPVRFTAIFGLRGGDGILSVDET